ncbi:MAG: hypothetical protein ACYTGX_09505 [Planctomycetota bacterium]
MRSGRAGEWMGQNYCAPCFQGLGQTAPVVDAAPAPRSRRSGSGRRRAARQAPARSRTGLALAGVAAASLGLLGVLASCTANETAEPVRPEQAPVIDTPAPTPIPAPAPQSEKEHAQIEAALEQLRERLQESRAFDMRSGKPEEWKLVDERYAALLASKAWTRDGMAGDAGVTALRKEVELARRIARERFEISGREAIQRAISRATAYASRDRHAEALAQLDAVPPLFMTLASWKALEELRAKLIIQRDTPKWTPGAWVDVGTSAWSLPASQKAQLSEDVDSGAVVIDGSPKGCVAIFTPRHSENWKDYVVEIEAFAAAGAQDRSLIQLGMRIQSRNRRLAGKAFSFKPEYCGRWLKVRVEVKGDRLTATVDGEQVSW